MKGSNADGNVIEVNLSTVKVQNFDNTITTIPTYKLVSDSFINWRGMDESDGRRIKRSLLIKPSSIKFLDDEEIEPKNIPVATIEAMVIPISLATNELFPAFLLLALIFFLCSCLTSIVIGLFVVSIYITNPIKKYICTAVAGVSNKNKFCNAVLFKNIN